MAHGEDSRRAVRAAYVFDQLSLEVAAAKIGVPYATVRNWKRTGKELGDDWDKARGAQMIAGGGIEDVVRQTLGIVVQQVQATVQAIQDAPDMLPGEKVQALASLADAYNKLMAASRKMMPETDKLAVATDVAKRLAEFVRTNYPQHAPAFAEILAPFGDELAKAYG
ncbi:MAG: DNA-binding protein [Gallionellales bacterium GWA2_60_18]|nr:MAG: DNA-binding protein [Gallionellales bacterium GWA2_60_18]